MCTLCGAQGVPYGSAARKYTATKDVTAHIYNIGYHTCKPKIINERQTDVVAKAIAVDPTVKPSAIQGNVVLTIMRQRLPWNEIKKSVYKLTDKKVISNEKVKQKKLLPPQGVSFAAVKEYKEYTDTEDKFLVFTVDEDKQIVFKTSKTKLFGCPRNVYCQ